MSLLFVCLLLLLTSSPLSASEASPSGASSVTHQGFSFSPSRDSRSFLLTELGFLLHLASQGSTPREQWRLTSDLGAMVNIGERLSLGASAFIATDFNYGRFGVKPRVRLWLGPRSALDITAGFTLATLEYTRASNMIGAAITYRDLIGAALEVDVLQGGWSGNEGTQMDWFGGIKTGGRTGAAGTLLGAAVSIGVFLVLYIGLSGAQ